MVVIFRKVPEKTTKSDLMGFIEPVVKNRWFRKKAVIVDIKVVNLKERGFNHSEFHGLVIIEPDATAEKVIRHLNRKKFLGKHIYVREYHRRLWHNDAREKHHSQNLNIPCRRVADRRRKHLDVVKKDAPVEFTGDQSFYKQHN